jgi:hypothetical protein
MPTTYVKIDSVTVGAGGASSIAFTSIPQTYTDLVVKLSGRTTATNQTVLIRFNSDTTTTNYRRFVLGGTGSGGGFSQNINDNGIGYVPISTYTANVFGVAEIYIPNYAGSGYKAYNTDSTTENNAVESYTALAGTYWNSTAAITSITLTNAGNWAQYSTATLYGVLNYTEAGTGTKAVGGTVTTAGGYTYHTFFSSGVFRPTTNITGAEVLVVAGGGGSADAVSGGGGAGGLVYASSQSYTSGVNYAAVVGAGGSGLAPFNTVGSIGSNSRFAAGTVALGGGGGSSYQQNGGSGGSGGGAGASAGVGGAGTGGQGNSGGNNGSGFAGGGGGAGAVGTTGGTAGVPRGGDGGDGLSTYSAWGLATGTGHNLNGVVWYAGGGGGSAWNGVSAANIGGYGGSGGGGEGGGDGSGSNGKATAGLPNTGGGAGGHNAPGLSGGSGIIIVRYTT